MKNNEIKWTHWYEMFPGYAIKCIIINECTWPLGGLYRILCDDGMVSRVHKDNLIQRLVI